jgi:hypothetical protein
MAKQVLIRYMLGCPVYCITLDFHSVRDSEIQDAHTHAAQILLLTQHHIHCAQTTQNTLEFENREDCQFASLALSNNAHYTVRS